MSDAVRDDRPSGDAARAKGIKEVGGFELIGKLGQGGMGTVYKARQKSLDRVVALKLLPPSIAKDKRYIDRFQREARACAKLNHPNIVQGIDVGQDEATGLWYFAMELVEGPTLKKVLADQKVLPEARVVKIAIDIAQALECASRHGIVHRDIKPDNILMTLREEAKLADLGLAKEASDDSSLTQSGQAVGTPHYMSPEQARGEISEIDVRTDIYALGATMFHLVTGQTPFTGTSSAVILSKHLTEAPPLANRVNPAVSEPLARLIARMMQKNKKDRVQTAPELLDALKKIQSGGDHGAKLAAGRATTGPRTPVQGKEKDKPRPSPVPMLAGIGGLAVIVVICMVLVGNNGHDHTAANSQAHATASNSPMAPVNTSAATPAAPAKDPAKDLEIEKALKAELEKAQREEAAKAAALAAQQAQKKQEEEKVLASPLPPSPDAEKKPDEKKPEEKKPEEKKPETPAAAVEAPKKEEPRKPDDSSSLVVSAARRESRGFKAEYFDGNHFEALKRTQEDEKIDYKWTPAPPEITPRAYSIRWSGYVAPAASGAHVFEVVSDRSSKLFVDGRVVHDCWRLNGNAVRTAPLELEAGKKYFVCYEVNCNGASSGSLKWGLDNGGELALVTAEPPETEKDGLPVGHLRDGWTAEYGPVGSDKILERTETAIYWNWNHLSPTPDMKGDNFWGRWTGLVKAPETDEYVFHLDFDEQVRIFVNNLLLLDAYNQNPGQFDTPALRLEGGKKYKVRVEFRDAAGPSHASLRWSSKSIQKALVCAEGNGKEDGELQPEGFLAEYGNINLEPNEKKEGKEGKGQPEPRQQGEERKVLFSRREMQAGWQWGVGSPAPDINNDGFWVSYTGWIKPPADGEYTFNLEADDGMRFFLDDVLLFSTWNQRNEGVVKTDVAVPLKGGKYYFVRLEYHELWNSARLQFLWKSEQMAEQYVRAVPPDAVKSQSRDVAHLDFGLLAEYGNINNRSPLLRRREARLMHDFQSATPDPLIQPDGFWGHWTGGLRITDPGNYVFRLQADERGEVKLANTSIIKLKNPGNEDSQFIPLQKGQYNLDVVLFEDSNTSHIRLWWKPPGKTEFEQIPPTAFILPPTASSVPRKLPK